ncbi:MAG: acyltransferase family protein [Burkholderiaceae bacterium]
MPDRKTFHLNNFDLLRLFAALQVVVFHTSTRFDLSLGSWETLVNAFPGVPIFFVISGFLISTSYERSKSLYRYTRNRLLRILPALWMCLLLTAGTALTFGYDLLNLKGIAWFFAQMGGLIYTPGALREFGFGSYNGALWTIPVELQFYAVLPVAYWLLSDNGKRTRSLAIVAFAFLLVALIYQTHLASLDPALGEPRWAKLLRYTFVPHFYLFMVGVCLQRLRAEESVLIKGKGLYWLIAYLAVVFTMPDNVAVHVFKLIMLAVATISIAYTLPGVPSRILGGNDISYGIYIYHGLIHNIFFELGYTGNWINGWQTVAITILVGIVSWVAIERPFIRRKDSTKVGPDLKLADALAPGSS